MTCKAYPQAFRQHVARAYGPDSFLQGPEPSPEAKESASVVYRALHKRLWGLPRDGVPRWKSPPEEVFQLCTEEQFMDEYCRLVGWVWSFRHLPYSAEFFDLSSLSLAPCSRNGEELGSPFTVHKPSVSPLGCFGRDADQVRCGPRAGLIVTYKGRLVKIHEVVRTPNVSRIYKYVITHSLAEIRRHGLWHAVRMFHRVVHMSVTTESLAEHAGSVLRRMERKANNCGRVGAFISAARLRMAGLQGLGHEEAFLATALNYHFECAGPEGWHFDRRSPKRKLQRRLQDPCGQRQRFYLLVVRFCCNSRAPYACMPSEVLLGCLAPVDAIKHYMLQ